VPAETCESGDRLPLHSGNQKVVNSSHVIIWLLSSRVWVRVSVRLLGLVFDGYESACMTSVVAALFQNLPVTSRPCDKLTAILFNRYIVIYRECYYPSMRTENMGLLALFSVRQGRWVYLFSKMSYIVSGGALNSTHSLTHLIDWGLASPAQCTLYGNPQTVDRNSWKRLQIAIDVLT